MEATVWFNPSCSKCRTAQGLLAERGVDTELVRYLDEAPTREDLERVMGMLGINDPRDMMRESEAIYAEEGLAEATPEERLEAMVRHPSLIQRPIVIVGDRAIIARPPERLLELLDDDAG